MTEITRTDFCTWSYFCVRIVASPKGLNCLQMFSSMIIKSTEVGRVFVLHVIVFSVE